MASGQKRCTITGDRYNTAPMEYLLVGRRATAARHLPGFTRKYTQALEQLKRYSSSIGDLHFPGDNFFLVGIFLVVATF